MAQYVRLRFLMSLFGRRPMLPLFLLCILLLSFTPTSDAYRCQSCFAGCRTFDDCDCDGDENSTCEADYCYAKLEYFNDDGVSAIQKGCTNHASSSLIGCQYASDDRSIACFCSGDLCNSAVNLSSYDTPELPVVTCCECNNDESGNEICFPQNCSRNCTGNYCYLDMVAVAQGCGWGHPQLFHFLRTQKYRRWEHELTCAEYYDNYRNYMSGCTCSGDMCNVITDIDRLNVHRRSQSDERKSHICYSLYAQSDTAFGAEVYRHSNHCPSYYCFISLTTVEVISDSPEEDDDSIAEELGSGDDGEYYGNKRHSDYSLSKSGSPLPTLRSVYEISAGCLHVDDDEKVQLGCTIEWSQSEHSPLTKHCVCAEKLCNDFHLIEDRRVTTVAPSRTEDESHRPPFRPGSLSSFSPTDASTTVSVPEVSEATITDLGLAESRESPVPVTSAFVPSEPNFVDSSSSSIPTTKTVQSTQPTTSGSQPPEGHCHSDGAVVWKPMYVSIVFVCTLISVYTTMSKL